MELDLEFIVPPADLQPFVSLFYRFACPGDFEDLERAAIAQLRFRLTPGDSSYHFADDTVQAVPAYHVVGPTTGASRTSAKGPLKVFGMGLTPAGWATLMDRDASAMVNRCVDAVSLFGPSVTEAAIGLRNARSGAEMVAAIEPWLRGRLASEQSGALSFVRAVDTWLAASRSPEVDGLVALSGLSRRHVERRCNALYGAPPKLLARKYRALRAAVSMASGEEVDIDGFYDQSHMIREVKHFTGLTPKKMRDTPGVLAALTIQRRRALEGQVGSLISTT